MRMPKRPPEFSTLISQMAQEGWASIMGTVREPTHQGKYLHWDELLRRTPPEGLSYKQWWVGLKMNRNSPRKVVPLRDIRGQASSFTLPEAAQKLLHEITQRASGTMGASDQVTNPETRDRYIIRNLMEEGITSSLIEGAATTREQAKQMLKTNRKPKNRGEQMVLNNYRAMLEIRDLGKASLTPDIVLHLHETVTQKTLDDPTGAGRLRREDEKVDVVDTYNNVLHDPPSANELPRRLEDMCAFANGKTPEGFVHPVVRSILLHYWLAYDHPFKDGNGRTARALFYWSMLQHDYWLCQFVSISQIIFNAPSQYVRSFLHCQADDNDLTYFILHQLGIIRKAIDELHSFIDRKLREREQLQSRLRLDSPLNHRQLELVNHALRHPDAWYDIRQHQYDHGVVYETARTDLLDLETKGLLLKHKRGRTLYFRPQPDLDSVLQAL